nr:hypothetical protein [Tanacetum cinerariifolium]
MAEIEEIDFLNTFESSNDNTNVVNAPQDPFVFNQDPGENSSQSPPHIDHHCCYGCGDSLDGIFCHQCTCESCRNGAHYGYNFPPKVLIISNLEPCHNQNIDEFPQTLPSFHPTCNSGDKNSFTYDSNLNFVDDSPNPPPQPLTFSSFINLLKKQVSKFYMIMKTDNESFSDEDVPKEIYSNPLFDEEIISIKIDPHHFNIDSDLIESLLNQDSSIISSPKFDSLLEEFSCELAHIDLIPPGINETDFDPEEEICPVERLLYDNSSPLPPKKPNSKNSNAVIESSSPSSILVEDSDSLMEEIDLFLTSDDSM